MKNQLAVMVPVIESEKGWGQKIEDHMVCLTNDDAKQFTKEFNAKNTLEHTPDWYMYAENETIPVDITESQMKFLKKNKRVWYKQLIKSSIGHLKNFKI